MWKKVLAVICIPAATFGSLAILPYGLMVLKNFSGEEVLSYKVTYMAVSFGFVVLWATAMFFWWRWIVRTLRKART